MTSWQLRPGGLYVPPDAADGPYLVQKDGNRFSQWLRLVDGDNTTVVTDPDAGTVQVDSTGGGSGGAGEPHIDTDTATTGADLVMTLTAEPAAPEALLVFWRGVGLDPTQYSYVGTALTVLDQGWTTGDLVWAAYWSEVPTVVTDPTTTLGDILVRGPSGLTRLPVGADGYVLTADSGATDGLDWEPGGGGGAAWNLVINDPLSSTSGLLAAAGGSWAISGGVLRQSTTSGFARERHATTVMPVGIRAVECEMSYVSGSGTRRMGLYVNSPNTTSTDLLVYVESGNGTTWSIKCESEGTTLYYTSGTISYAGSGYLRLGVLQVAGVLEIYLGGVYFASISVPNNWTPGPYVGVYTLNQSADFRNLKAWNTLAAEPF